MVKCIDKFDGEHAFLSNFYVSEIKTFHFTYPTVEHAFQANKTHILEEKEAIWEATTPGKAKRLGRKTTLREDWDEVRVMIMHSLCKIKFKDADLAAKLLATGDAELIEGNTWNDTFWGVCNGKGSNHLGKILMKIRKELK